VTSRSFSGQVAVVTGAASGLGAAAAWQLATEGARVVVVDIDADGARKVAEDLPGESAWVQADVSSEADVARYVAAAVDRFGRIDLHHVNAGIPGTQAPLPDISLDEFDQVMNVNLRGSFLGVRAAFRQFREQGSGGAIVITASIASLRGSADLLPYQISKHAVLGLLQGAAVYGGPLGIRVNAVAPGIVPTELFMARPGGKEDMERRARTVPLRRAGQAAEIASVVAFLLSDEAAYMTGSVVSVDGGAAAMSTVRASGGAGAWDTGPLDAYSGLSS
jgi:NAD(P)-dependent dehydrogenase (short-subunit alcohol dehydrogenase family)